VADALVLLSGGIDSSATLDLCIKTFSRATAVFVDYGQPAANREHQAATKIAVHYSAKLTVVTCAGVAIPESGEIRGRNALLLGIALVSVASLPSVVAIGIHGGTPYTDCSEDFIRGIKDLYEVQTQGGVELFAPFLNWSKRDIWAYACREAIPLEMTYSCERGGVQPCGRCRSCADLVALRC